MAWRFPKMRLPAAGLAATAGVWLAMAAVGAGPVSATDATDATYATYMRIHGDWVVLCGFDEPTRRRWCDLKAPPPALGVTRSEMVIERDGQGGHVVKVRIGHPVSPGAPVYLRVDANPPHQAQPTRTGELEWRGGEAAAILAELGGGSAMTLRSFTGTPAQPRDEAYSLALFNRAFLDLKSKVGS